MSLTEARSATELAARYKREAYIERHCKADTPISAALSEIWERAATEVLTLPNSPDVGAGGEVVQRNSLPDAHVGKVRPRSKAFAIRDTLTQGATRVAEDASIQRADLLLQPSLDAVAMGIDAAESIGAENSLEKMLAHQMAVAHQVAMTFADKALTSCQQHPKAGDSIDATRYANTAARLMSAFQDGLLALARIRSGGSQTVTVQHVTVAQGGQALIGNVDTGGSKRRGSKSKNG
ncbi:MAG TPA: hypothetical protein VKR31_05530 [Rhizomicrobium sp.]|nr:hypothetical protein [Rhizomicrobium sp.]